MTVAVLTAIYDGYDTLKPVVPQDVDVEFICVSDVQQPADLGWRIVVEERPGIHPNRAAKRPKMVPWVYTDAREYVWLDASFRITSPSLASGALSYADPIAQFVHPWRDCVYSEAVESSLLPKYAHLPVLEQVEHYRKAGMPEGWGLWATGVIAWKRTPDTELFGPLWHRENASRTYQDQLSEAYWLWRLGLRPNSLPGTHFVNPWVTYEGSGRH